MKSLASTQALVLLPLLAAACASEEKPTSPAAPADAMPDSAVDVPTVDTGTDTVFDTSMDAVHEDSSGPPPALYAGFRAATYSVRSTDPSYWDGVGHSMAGRFTGAASAGAWIVCVVDEGVCRFQADSFHEPYLSYFDTHGTSVWLQVESGLEDVPTLIDKVLGLYGGHPSVVGFGVDVEWLGYPTHPEGRQVTDAEAEAWSAQVKSYNPSYTLFLKHWRTAEMPPTARGDILFVNDSQRLASLDAMVDEFTTWGAAFPNNPVAFQYGYESDRVWWGTLADPPGDIGNALIDAIPNTKGLFWVDFTVTDVFPP